MAQNDRVKPTRRLFRGLLLSAAPLAVISVAGYYYATGGQHISTENAYVKAEIVSLSSNIEGQVTQVFVDDNQLVEKGDPLFTLDPRPFEIALAAARAEMRNTSQRIESLRARYRRGQMETAAAEERLRFLQLAHERQQSLLSKGVASQARFDETEHELLFAQRRLLVAQETNRIVLAELGGDFDLPAKAHPLYLKALANQERAALNLSYTKVTAPASGVLSSVTLEPGEYIEAGQSLFALVIVEDPWVEANLKEVQLTHVRIGQNATVVVDSHPDVKMTAVVDSISPATGAEFAVLPPQNASGNWVKVVQRVPVRLKLTSERHKHLLRAGMTASVSIDTEREGRAAALYRQYFAPEAEARQMAVGQASNGQAGNDLRISSQAVDKIK